MNATNSMELFDAHIHSEGRSVEELKKMSENGIKKALTCAFYPIQPKYGETLIDLFRKLVEFESYRGKKAGMRIYAAVGIHPRCIPPNWRDVIEFMETDFGYVAFGEIGLEDGDEREIEVLKSQLMLAKRLDVPCIIHTPRRNKKVITEKILKILEEISFPEDLALIDHVSFETFEMIREKNYHIGLTVQPGKLSVEDAVEIINKYGDEKIVANSDTGFSESDMLAVRKLYDACRNLKVTSENAEKFLRI